MTRILPEIMRPLRITHDRQPSKHNGEEFIHRLLVLQGFGVEYESILYLFPTADGGVCPGFQPDLPLFLGDDELPWCSVEVSWFDHPQTVRTHGRHSNRTSERKQQKIETAWGLYRIPTLLLNYRATMAIKENPSLLKALLKTIHDSDGDQGLYFPQQADLLSRRDWRR